jgi:MtN3 and saliva related transmembrane protein
MEDYDGFILPAIGFVATGFAVSSTVPQISKALRTKKSDDISLRFIVVLVLIIGLSFWVIYGIGKREVVLIIGNSIAVILNTILLILKIKYSRDPLREEW